MSDYIHEISDDETTHIHRFLRTLAISMVLFVLAVILLFITAESWLKLISPESEHRFIDPYIKWSQGTLLVQADAELQTYVESLAADIYAPLDDDQPIRVQVIEGDTVNAFATLGGHIFVFEGLIDALDSENSLAMVLAHEIAHVHHRDPLLSTGRGMLIQLTISALTGNGMDPNGIDTSSEVLLNQYSREQELAADELALSLLQRRYGHVGGATRLFDIIDETGSVDVAEFLSTHPDLGSRIDQIENLSDTYNWVTDSQTPYPKAIRAALTN